MDKSLLRKLYKDKRTAISVAAFQQLCDLILIRFQSLGLTIPMQILSYLPLEKYGEIDLFKVEEYCNWQNPGCTFSYPVVDEQDSTMQAVVPVGNDAFVKNKWDIAEPRGGVPLRSTEVDMVFVPLLAFDKTGHRLGYGKGYYDRYLRSCRPDVVKIGFSFFDAEEDLIECNEFDVVLNFCITPHKIYTF